MSDPTHIVVHNAREHNLRGVDLSIPRRSLVVFTGVSGSGKSSLAFDTLYQEGQRRFMESLSSYARQFLGQMERPKVDLVEGISPTLSIDQKTVNRNPRSTVGTITEIHDHLRLLYARLGTPHCPKCGTPIAHVAVDQIVDEIMARGKGKKTQILGPIIRERKGEYRKELAELLRDGWTKARIDGELSDLESPPELARYEKHTVEVVVDRLVPNESDRPRLAEAVETAIRLSGEGLVTVLIETEEMSFSTERSCVNHPDVSIPELEPRTFSFNAPQGACPECEGLGVVASFVLERIVDIDQTLPDAYLVWNDNGRVPFSYFDRPTLLKIAKKLGGPLQKKLRDWPADVLVKLLYGDAEMTYEIAVDREGGGTDVRHRPWNGLMGLIENIWRWTSFAGLEKYRDSRICAGCEGSRLNEIARAVLFRGRPIHHCLNLSVADAHAFFGSIELIGSERDIGATLLQEMRDRLAFLHEVGLDYLTLDRSAVTLSGGEAQRIRLAAQVGSALQGVTYVLDEPSIGLHPRDNQRLLQALFRLRDRGNSVIVVEHDADTIMAADWVVDVGPGAGREGGYIIASGPPETFIQADTSTARFLRGEDVIAAPQQRRKGNGKALIVRGATSNNLKNVDVEFPLGKLTVVTGVSGSGKSTLVFDVLEPAVQAAMLGKDKHEGCTAVEGTAEIDKVITITQSPIGRTPRSNPATYTGLMDHVRDLMAATAESRARGYKKGRFSFNVAGGRCEACEGAGVKTVEMQFLPSVEVPCDVCNGKRFNAETLEITWKGKNISELLDMTIAEAHPFFSAVPKLARVLATLLSVGLGYISLGQPATTLSGGEAQRLKLASELYRPATGKTLYLLDEPTTGLHFEDVRRLLDAIQRLVDGGNTAIVVEHHTDVIKCADHLVDMGPEGGTGGGRLVGEGKPEKIAKLPTPTGRALALLPEFGGALLAAEARPRPLLSLEGPSELVIRGARQHNLQSIDVRIPHGKMTVITGPSGSGKTSLAFDTIFSEGQRRYVESLSTYARRFLGRMDRAPVDSIEGLAPAIAIDQHNTSHNPRSTVATVTEIHDVLRLLYARIGQGFCPICDKPVEGFDPSAAANRLRQLAPGPGWLYTRLLPASTPEERRKSLVADGYSRLLVDGVELGLDEAAAVKALEQGAFLVIDRFDPAKVAATRLAEAIGSAQNLGGGLAQFQARGGAVARFPRKPSCPEHGEVLPAELTPRHFSFNSQLGACTTCDGIGRVRAIVPDRVFPRPELAWAQAIDPRVGSLLQRSMRNVQLIRAVLESLGIKDTTPLNKLTPKQRQGFLYGLPGEFAVKWTREWGRSKQTVEENLPWAGIIPTIQSWNAKVEWLVAETTCPACQGGRLRPELLCVRIGGQGIHQLASITVKAARTTIEGWELVGEAALIAERPLAELRKRLRFLDDVGLGYLSLDRAADTLSGGESQRIRLASQLGTGLTGVIYVLDEPTIGLHPRDTDRLLATLENLRDLGNTVVLVEHDPDTIRRADYVLDLGPGAGRYGGNLLASGTPAEIIANPESLTGGWLSGRIHMPVKGTARSPRGKMTLKGARAHNLRGDDVVFPTGQWIAVTGVSGSGKSTLVMDTLAPALRRTLGEEVDIAAHTSFETSEKIDKVVIVDQQPIGRTPRSTPATYVGLMDPLRALFAELPGSRERGWAAGRFSFNAAGGRCEICEGRGATLVEMHFLPDVWITCPSCNGKRYNRETLAVRFKGFSIADILGIRADEALPLFSAQRKLARPLQALVDVGLGYLSLGQPGTTLSGGEAQRVKLAAELGSRAGHAVYILDEPTTGLHLSDVAKLVEVLDRLVDSGHTVITIEHHLDMIRHADHVIEMGPDGGEAGGKLVAQGSIADLVNADTATGRAFGIPPKPKARAKRK